MTTPSKVVYREIALNNKGVVARVSPRVFAMLMLKNWRAFRANNGYYAATSVSRNGKKKLVLMHRVIMGLENGYPRCVDHANGDTLDNTDQNLRIATQQ